MYSLSRTLVVRFSLTIFVALLLIALWAYLGTQRILHEQLDRDLRAESQLALASLAAGGRLGAQEDGTTLDAFIESVNRFVAVRDSRGGIVETNVRAAAALPLDSAAFATALDGEAALATVQWPHGELHTIYAPIPPHGRPERAVLQVGAADRPLAAATRTVLGLMLGTVLLGTLATIFGAGWLARVSVEPVARITAEANAIRPGTTGNRITVHADVAEYHGLVEVLNRMLERLDRGLESERRIIADVGHDLRTPVTAMRGEIEVALRCEREGGEYRRILKSLLEEVEHLSSISEALVMLARIEAGQLAPLRQPTDVGRVMAAAVERAAARAGTRVITFSQEGDTELRVDEGMVAIAVDQLLDNAIRHTPDGTAVAALVLADAARARIVVQDDGAGVPDDALVFLFDRFYRANHARSRGGAGLGLTICRAIAEAHGGAIIADRPPRGGLRITLDLPRRSVEHAAA